MCFLVDKNFTECRVIPDLISISDNNISLMIMLNIPHTCVMASGSLDGGRGGYFMCQNLKKRGSYHKFCKK